MKTSATIDRVIGVLAPMPAWMSTTAIRAAVGQGPGRPVVSQRAVQAALTRLRKVNLVRYHHAAGWRWNGVARILKRFEVWVP